MASRAHYHDTITGKRADSSLVVLDSATVQVNQVGTSTPLDVPIYAARTGASTRTNPFTIAADGIIDFWLDVNAEVDIVISKSGYGSQTISVEVLSFPAVLYLLRDRFTNAVGPPLGTPRAAVPGPGIWTVTDVENSQKTLLGRLRGLVQPATPVWGESALIGPSTTRVAGRTFVALVIPEDQVSDLAMGWEVSNTAGDPRTHGHGWLGENGNLQAIAPGVKVTLDGGVRTHRPMQYLIAVVLNDQGATTLISSFGADSAGSGGMNDQVGIPQYPAARILWADYTSVLTPLYPYVSAYDALGYPNGHSIEDVRVLDVPQWAAADALVDVSDRFARVDSTTALGGTWTASIGTFGISANQAYVASGSGFFHASMPTTLYDGIYQWDWKVPSDWNGSNYSFGGIIRRQDSSNFLRLWNNAGNTITLQTWVAGGFGATVYTTAHTWVAGQTHRVVVLAKGNQYLILIDGVSKSGSVWQADTNNRFLTATGIGLYGNTGLQGSTFRWDNVVMFPHTVALPSILADGAVPKVVSAGATLATDTFTDTTGVRLNVHAAEAGGAWTEHVGTWTVQTNRASVAAVAGNNYATQELGNANVELQVDVITPAAFATNTVRAGVVARYVDANNRIIVRMYRDAGTGEIELIETIGGASNVVHKLALPLLVINTTYTLKVQLVNDLIHVLVNGDARMSYYTQSGSPLGTRHGLYREDADDGCVLDNYSAKAAT